MSDTIKGPATLKVGDIVEWDSCSRGTWTTKRGEVVYVGPPAPTGVDRARVRGRIYRRIQALTGDGGDWINRADRFAGYGVAVLVLRPSKRDPECFLKSYVYSPRPSALRVVEQAPRGGE